MTVLVGAALVTVFGIAAAGKLGGAGFRGFRDGVGRLWFGPGRPSPRLRHVLAVVVLAAELLVVAALTAGAVAAWASDPVWMAPGFGGAALLLGVFTVAHAVVVRGRRAVSCACFGRTRTVVGPLTLARSVVLSGLAILGLILATVPDSGRTSGPAALLDVVAGVAFGLVLVGLEDLVSLFRPLPPTGAARPSGRTGTAARESVR